jgi:hypothetical protein
LLSARTSKQKGNCNVRRAVVVQALVDCAANDIVTGIVRTVVGTDSDLREVQRSYDWYRGPAVNWGSICDEAASRAETEQADRQQTKEGFAHRGNSFTELISDVQILAFDRDGVFESAFVRNVR